MNKKKSVFFLIFSFLYCFILIDRSFYNLSGDNLNIGAILYHLLYPDNFPNDLIRINKGTYYLPCFVEPMRLIQEHTGNYILSLQIILFFQLFFSLLTTSYMVKALFEGIDGIKNVLLTLLISMTLVLLPCGEMIGVGTLFSAVARYSYSIFTPLLIIFYYKYENISISGRKIPSIIIIGALSGLLINLHPPSAITTYSVFLFHWFFYRSGISDNFRGSFFPVTINCAYSILLFLCLSLFYSVPYVEYGYFAKGDKEVTTLSQAIKPPPAPSPATPEAAGQSAPQTISSTPVPTAPLLSMDKIKNLSSFRPRMCFKLENFLFFIKHITFLAFIIPFIYFVCLFRKKDIAHLPNAPLLIFLRSLFITGFILSALGNLLGVNINFGPYFEAFRRADRFLFLVFELLAIYVILYGKGFIRNKLLYYAGAGGILFFWICLSKTKGIFQYNILSRVLPWADISPGPQTFAVNLLIIIAVLISIAVYRLKIFSANISRALLILALLPVLYIWPVLSGGIPVTLNHILYSCNGIGSWALMGKITSSKAYEMTKDFETTCGWLRKNTPANSRILYFDREKSQNFKLCSKRNGMCTVDEVGFIPSTAYYLGLLYDSSDTDLPEALVKFSDKYKLQYILISKRDVPEFKTPSSMRLLYDSKYYSIFSVASAVY